MKERKNIDRIFQEKFRDFEATPREEAWKKISAKLQEKQRRPLVTPLWSRIAGVAALFTLFFFTGDWFTSKQTNTIVNSMEETSEDFIPSALPSAEIVSNQDIEQSLPLKEPVISTTGSNDRVPVKREFDKPLQKVSSILASGVKKPASTFHSPGPVEPLGQEESSETAIVSLVQEQRPELGGDQNSMGEKVASGDSDIRIELKTQAAPIFYGNFGKGNLIDPKFNDNSSQSEITYSYGIHVAFAFNDKFSIRSGVNKVALSYNINDVAYHSVIDPEAISNINYSKDNIDFGLVSSPTTGKNNPPPNTSRAYVGEILPGFLNQRMGFIEVPVEISYNIIDNKFEVTLIGGASTFFLDENIISVNTADLTTKLGEANNLNLVSFSTNLGLGLDYNLSEKIKINLEPTLKYQLNTFSGSSRNQPYFLGVYSGFSFKF